MLEKKSYPRRRALLMAVRGLDAVSFGRPGGTEDDTVSGLCWENSYIRGWLNGEFFAAAFTEEEKTIIIESEREIKVEEYKGAQLVSRITEKNSNKLFNLSKDEYERYCKENQSIYIGSPYVLLSIRKGKNGYSNVHNATRCRPAVWVDLSDDFNESLLENLE